MDSLFEFYPAQHPSDKSPCGLISIPHSGLNIPSEFRAGFIDNEKELNCDVDYAVHECIDIPRIQAAGIHLIKFNYHRTFIDLNRSREQALQNWPQNTKGTKLYQFQLDDKEAILQKYWDSYFFIIEQMIENSKNYFPFIDLHSMPSKATAYHLAKNPNQAEQRPDFCLSDFLGSSCPEEFIRLGEETFQKKWKKTSVNDPYKGGYITQHFKDFKNPNIQIEINRSLYMDEENIELISEKHSLLKNQLTEVLLQLLTNWSAAKKDSV